MNANYKRGFTLIELLVVIAIIGILSSVVLASLNSARQKGRDARRISDMKQIQLALELFYDANQSYPTTTAGAAVALSTVTGLTGGGYIAALPSDPGGVNNGYRYQPLSSANPGVTCATATCPSYAIIAQLETANHSSLVGDVDGTQGTLDCTDTSTAWFYCQRP